MIKYIIKRILLALLMLFGVSIILYFLVRLMPVNYIERQYIETHSSTGFDPVEFNEFLASYGLENLDGMGFWQKIGSIFKGYWTWLGNFVQGDFGVSFKYNGQKVEDVIARYMGTSFIVSFVSLVLELIIAIPLGIKAACNQYGKLDYVTTVLTMIGISFPSFFFGSLVIKIFAVDLGWFPVGGMGSSNFFDRLWHLILPILVLTILSVGSMMRYTRTNTLEVLNADYIRTARAKGLSERTVVYKHVFRNTLIPLVTTLAGIIPSLFGGAMITETIFDIQGIGSIAYAAMIEGDIPFIMAYNMFIAVLTVIGILLTDLMYAVVDPRVKLGK